MSIRGDSKLATRAKVLDAARDLFNRDGYDQTTIRAIAERAGVSAGSVFTTFASKSEILFEVMHERLDGLADEIDELLPVLRGTTHNRLSTIFARVYQRTLEKPGLILALISSFFVWPKPAVAFQPNVRLVAAVQNVLNEAKSRGELAPDADLKLLYEAIVAAFYWNYRLVGTCTYSFEDLVIRMEAQLGLILEGASIRSPTGVP